MKAFIVILLLGLLPLCLTLACYSCSVFTGGCSDPFNAANSGVLISNSSTDTYCMKVKVSSTVTRAGISVCVAVSGSDNTVTTCCQTDLCNGASGQYHTTILLALSIFAILIKFK